MKQVVSNTHMACTCLHVYVRCGELCQNKVPMAGSAEMDNFLDSYASMLHYSHSQHPFYPTSFPAMTVVGIGSEKKCCCKIKIEVGRLRFGMGKSAQMVRNEDSKVQALQVFA